MIVYSRNVLAMIETCAASSPCPVSSERVTSTTLTANTRNWIGARIPCTSVQRVASRRTRCSGVYSALTAVALDAGAVGAAPRPGRIANLPSITAPHIG